MSKFLLNKIIDWYKIMNSAKFIVEYVIIICGYQILNMNIK